MVTKTDVFAKQDNRETLEQSNISDEITTARTESVIKRDSTCKEKEFVGTFDELNGVVTTKIYKEMKRKGRGGVNLEEETRNHQAQTE